jgi:hypothetical protein
MYRPPTFAPPPSGFDTTRSASQPPPSGRKSVQFANNVSEVTLTDDGQDSEEPGAHRHGESSRGLNPDDAHDEDRLRRHSTPAPPSTDIATGDGRRRHRRRKSHDPSSSAAGTSSSRAPDTSQDQGSSSDTLDLPPRFDKYGRRKVVPGEDPIGDRFEDIIAGKGVAGKLFGNFADGLFGGSTRGGGGRADEDGSDRRRN